MSCLKQPNASGLWRLYTAMTAFLAFMADVEISITLSQLSFKMAIFKTASM